MRRTAPILALVLLVLVGVWWRGTVSTPVDASPAAIDAPAPEPAPLVEPAPRRPLRFTRPPPQAMTPTPRAAGPVAGEDADRPEPAPAPEPEAYRDLDDLSPEILDELVADTMRPLGAVADACEEVFGDTVAFGAEVVVDEGGLRQLDLSPLAELDGELGFDPDGPLPPALAACIDDVLWDLEWPAFSGAPLRYAITWNLDAADP